MISLGIASGLKACPGFEVVGGERGFVETESVILDESGADGDMRKPLGLLACGGEVSVDEVFE